MQINVLGPIEVVRDGRPVRLSGQRQRALLAALVLEHGKVVSVDRLVDALWDARPPMTARAKVQAHVCALRQVAGGAGDDGGERAGWLLTRPPGYLLSTARVGLDLTEFEALSRLGDAAAGRGEPMAASALFGRALGMFRGTSFADVVSPLIRAAGQAIEDRRLLMVEAKAEADLGLGRPESVVSELRPWVAAHPLRERLRGLLMLAFYRLGCRADALCLYREGRRILVAELGLEPGPQLRDLHQLILADGAAPLRPSQVPG